MRLTEDKRFKTIKRGRKKNVTFIYIQAYESDTKRSLIQWDWVLHLKEYKEVPLSLRGCTHSLKLRLIPSTSCLDGRQNRTRDGAKIESDIVATIEAVCTTMHDVNIERALAD